MDANLDGFMTSSDYKAGSPSQLRIMELVARA
jgi:hypothetical protein